MREAPLSESPVETKANLLRTTKELESAQEALKQINQQHQTLTSMLSVGIFHMDMEGYRLYANPQAQKIAGIEGNKAESKHWLDLVHPADQQRAREAWQMCLQEPVGYVCKFECRFLLPDGQERPVLIQMMPELNKIGQIQRMVGFVADIAERKGLEKEQKKRADALTETISERTEALQQSNFNLRQKNIELEKAKIALTKTEGSFKAAISQLPIAIVRLEGSSITFANKAACTLAQLTEDQLKCEDWPKHIHPEDRERIWNIWQKTLAEKKEHVNVEYRRARPDGTCIWLVADVVVENVENEQIKSYLCVLTDISNLKALEVERLRAIQETAEYEHKRTEEVEAYRKRQEQFIDTMCHELRNPLSGIFGNVNLLQHNLAVLEKLIGIEAIKLEEMRQAISDHITQEKESLRAIDTCARHQKSIADDVLNLSKLEAGQVTLNPIDFNPKDVVKDVVDMLDAEIKRKGVEVYVKTPHSDMTVNGDRHRLSQVLLNLASNAIKFTPEGGKVTISLQPEKATESEVTLKFIVKDTGIGMTETEKARIFNRFEQATHATYAEYGGSGLGLVISKHLVGLMRGEIDVESEKGVGTKFTFTIKCKPVAVPVKAPPLPVSLFAGPAPRIRRRVLIVEDNVINQKILKRNLEQAGHICEVANNGKEAYEMVEKTPYDIVLMDVEMPVMDGLEATKLIRQREREQKKTPTPIVGLSGNAREEYIATAKGAGMNDYLTKPYERSVLLEKIAFYTLPSPEAKPTRHPAPTGGNIPATAGSSHSFSMSSSSDTDSFCAPMKD